MSNADCSGGEICTTIGCCPGCHVDADCGANSKCVAGSPNFCAPTNPDRMPPLVVDQTPKDDKLPSIVTTDKTAPTACVGDADCRSGTVCLAGLCQPACSGASCGDGQQCVAGRCYAANTNICGDSGLTLCTANAQCGSGRVCAGGSCHASCTVNTDCGIGEECSGGVCGTPSTPALAQCTFDSECGTAFRCINATCHSLCATDEQCGPKNRCDFGVCRANNRPGV
jgi:hypothetical protein